MTGRQALAELEDFRDILADAGYRCQLKSLGRFPRVLLAENPYAMIAIVDCAGWDALTEDVSDLQAELTRFALTGRRPNIRWDLYVLAHVRSDSLQSIRSEVADRIESDTKFARKFVRVNLTRDLVDLDRALRPFLPLRPPAVLDVADPMALVKAGLLEEGVEPSLVDSAVRSFLQTGEVRIP